MDYLPKLLITGDFQLPSDIDSSLRVAFNVVHLREVTTRETLLSALVDAAYYVLGGPEYLDDSLLGGADELVGVVVMGTATSSFVDLCAAATRGVRIANCPGLNAHTVAEFAIGLLIVANAAAFESYNSTVNGNEWFQGVRNDLDDCKIGLVGFGNVGRALASKIRALAPTCNLLYWSRHRHVPDEVALAIQYVSLDEMFSEVDLCCVQVAYNRQDTHHLIDASLLARGRGKLRLLNFSNPLIVDPAALRDALQNGCCKFAYMDGYYREWIYNDGIGNDLNGLLGLGPQKFVATSHIAALTHRTLDAILSSACRQLLDWKVEDNKPATAHPRLLPLQVPPPRS